MAELRVPKLNSNDDVYLLVEWLAPDGADVRAGQPVAVIETSKAAEEIESDRDGVLRHLVKAGASCAPGAVIAGVGAGDAPGPVLTPLTDGPLITAPAQALMDELGIGLDQVRALAAAVIRRSDVEHLAASRTSPAPASAASSEAVPAAAGERRPLSKVQRGVGRAVQLSHSTIPAAYSVVRADVEAALDLASRLTREVRRPIGLPELCLRAAARLHERFPLMFARLAGNDTLELPDAPHIGVTVDAGEGMYMPVVRDAARRPLKDVATTLMEFRISALNGEFRDSDLAGANFTLALHHDAEVALAIPLILPGTSCALALASPAREPVFTADGDVVARRVANLGLAYDHRLINGRDAAEFLRAVKESLETPEVLAGVQNS
ncbi:2-oxoglutarate dehydrogenase E2 component (dihydrolipoamide succinyltransferase) [Sinosporangium album]|uniref:Dihydrolipoamide acetyltransferase component of pyruvate dehydrogenase complex n=1 Tax=Sinosporangium album TaxID=504805 RepID=A0A1G7RZ38_9ACTN|nr:2-oxo acid dehydrogenase subunit E2 [Sinosporangium album]SDG16027.1 2-oxoglutarate dehydrogenase E2 component (dihydrolipoamide succinyltransferase) [Sinosporangium album]